MSVEEQQRWGRSRYAALLGVLALHLAVLTILLIAAKTRTRTTPAAIPIELLVLPQNAAPSAPPPPTVAGRHKKVSASPQPPPPDALTITTPNPSSGTAGPSIDWSQEAHNVAANIASRAPALDETKPSALSNSPFAEPPAHHKGEQIPTADGRWMVFVSDKCYQLSKEITHITNATNTGVKIQTYCNRRSKESRGDLFNQLPAYKKLHPDN
jgi:hypothetical protein